VIRVLHVASGNLYGGVETALVMLARERHRCQDMEPHFAVCFPGRLAEELAAAGAPVHMLGEVRVRRPVSIWRARRRLASLLFSAAIDVVTCHAPWTHALFGPVPRAAGRPLVLWLHAPFLGRHWLERWAHHTPPDALISNSRFTAAASAGAFANVPTEVVYFPVSLPEVKLGVAEQYAIRAELDTTVEATVIVQAGRMEPLKGWHMHIDALGALRDLSGWVAWFIGGPQGTTERRYSENLKHAARRLGIRDRIRFLGERTDVARLLGAADIYCQPNTEPDSFGLAAVEALLAGLPVVTTGAGGLAEIVDDTCALRVASDSRAVAAGLRQLVADATLRRQLGASGLARVQKLCHPTTQMKHVGRALAAVAERYRHHTLAREVDT